jgi:DNA topoisomerase-1
MARRGGWRRVGSRRRFRYRDSRGAEITDPATLERIDVLRIPPAWRDVWISPSPTAKLQATGIDSAGRRQYLYHADFREQQEQAKYDRLILFAERLPDLRKAMTDHMEEEGLGFERVCAVAVRLINLGWFRVGHDRYAKTSRTFGITTLTKRHVSVRGSRIVFRFRGKGNAHVHTALIDDELAGVVQEFLALPGDSRVFRFEADGELCNLTGDRLNEYIRTLMGEQFTAIDFRTWGGTLIAAIRLAERGLPRSDADAKRNLAAAARHVGERLGNTPAVARSAYISPAVIEQYFDGRTIEDFRPAQLRVVRARETGLDAKELALLSLLRSWRIRRARLAA